MRSDRISARLPNAEAEAFIFYLVVPCKFLEFTARTAANVSPRFSLRNDIVISQVLASANARLNCKAKHIAIIPKLSVCVLICGSNTIYVYQRHRFTFLSIRIWFVSLYIGILLFETKASDSGRSLGLLINLGLYFTSGKGNCGLLCC